MPTEPQLRLNNVSKRYASGKPVLDNFSLELEPHDFVALIGPRGCGKSTILRLISGLTPLSGGEIVHAEASEQRRTSYIFSQPALLPWRTVESNVRLPYRLQGASEAETEERVREVLKLWDIAHVSDRFPLQLTAGMKMRTSLARGMVTQPRCLLLDEPFGTLDAITRNKLSADLMRVREKRPFVGFLVTHSAAEAVFLANKVVVLHANPGRIAEVIDVPADHPRKLAWRETDDFQDAVAQVRTALNAVQEAAKQP